MFGNHHPIWTHSWWPETLGSCPCPVYSARNLDVIVDINLSFNLQVNKIVSPCFWVIRPLSKIFPFLSLATRKQAAVALIPSKIDYYNALYLDINRGSINKLQLVPNVTARLVLDIPKYHSISAAIKKLHWLPAEKRIFFKPLCIVHKALHNSGPEGILHIFQRYVPASKLRSANKNCLVVPRYRRSRWGGRAFSVAVAKLWSTLPPFISCVELHLPFRKTLKTWLFAL